MLHSAAFQLEVGWYLQYMATIKVSKQDAESGNGNPEDWGKSLRDSNKAFPYHLSRWERAQSKMTQVSLLHRATIGPSRATNNTAILACSSHQPIHLIAVSMNSADCDCDVQRNAVLTLQTCSTCSFQWLRKRTHSSRLLRSRRLCGRCLFCQTQTMTQASTNR